MPVSLSRLKGMTPEIAGKLRAMLITNVDKFREAVDTPGDRQALADKLGIDSSELRALGNRADLSRIKGVGAVYTDLLEFSGVDSVAELAQRAPQNLYGQILSVAERHSVRRTPSLADVEDWVAQANELHGNH